MNEDFLYHKIQEALTNIPENFNILEEQIDVQLQMAYFEYSKKLREEVSPEEFLDKRESLLDPDGPEEDKKKILVMLASTGKVEDFRLIEKFLKAPYPGLEDWAILALQESRMLLQSALLDEQQVFISTGLGGKGRNLRYFVVFLNKEGNGLTGMQKKLLKDELRYVIEKSGGELEEFQVMLDFTTATVNLPLTAPLKDIFRGIIDECNVYGDFLEEDMVITNVKKLNTAEIVDILKQQRARPEEEQ